MASPKFSPIFVYAVAGGVFSANDQTKNIILFSDMYRDMPAFVLYLIEMVISFNFFILLISKSWDWLSLYPQTLGMEPQKLGTNVITTTRLTWYN